MIEGLVENRNDSVSEDKEPSAYTEEELHNQNTNTNDAPFLARKPSHANNPIGQ